MQRKSKLFIVTIRFKIHVGKYLKTTGRIDGVSFFDARHRFFACLLHPRDEKQFRQTFFTSASIPRLAPRFQRTFSAASAL
jgi:hypothetical protein